MQFTDYQQIFANYEISKLSIAHPSITNLILYIIILSIAVISGQKYKTNLLDKTQTNQLKGIAILLIVISHLWFHVSSNRAIPMLGDYSVTLFLMLSGFGLTRSLANRRLFLGDFISRRLRKVMVPYWIVTIIIILLDYIMLNRTYSIRNIISTFMGYNLNPVLREIDYARWFITLLLIYYIAFFLANRFLSNGKAIICLILFGIFLMLLKHFGILHLGKYNQAIAFPIGCLLAYYYNDLSYLSNNTMIYLFLIIFIILIMSALIGSLSYISDKHIYIYTLTELCVYTFNGILYSFGLIMIVGAIGNIGLISGFLSYCGALSYEIYLIHRPLLIKYNPFFKLMPTGLIVVSFSIYLAVVLVLAYGLQRLTNALSQRDKIMVKNIQG